jgi:cyclophilin family peptidyl-prolyl cis-trans isomerase
MKTLTTPLLPVLIVVMSSAPLLLAAQAKPAADPIFVLETVKGIVEIRLFQGDAPKSVAHLLALIRRSYYRGQRIHRVTASLVQFGDVQSRDMTKKDYWGSGGSGTPINAFELVKKYTHRRGMVGLAHSGNPMAADSQLYIMKQPSSGLDGKHAIVGQVTTGLGVVDTLAVGDMIRLAFVKGEGQK